MHCSSFFWSSNIFHNSKLSSFFHIKGKGVFFQPLVLWGIIAWHCLVWLVLCSSCLLVILFFTRLLLYLFSPLLLFTKGIKNLNNKKNHDKQSWYQWKAILIYKPCPGPLSRSFKEKQSIWIPFFIIWNRCNVNVETAMQIPCFVVFGGLN